MKKNNLAVFHFQGVEEGCIWNKWVNENNSSSTKVVGSLEYSLRDASK